MVSLEKRRAASASHVDAANLGDDADALGGPRRTRQGWEWTVGSMRREHTHDVKALAIHGQSLDGGRVGAARKGPVLVSAGVDASLSLYSVPGFKTQASLCLLSDVSIIHRQLCAVRHNKIRPHAPPLFLLAFAPPPHHPPASRVVSTKVTIASGR